MCVNRGRDVRKPSGTTESIDVFTVNTYIFQDTGTVHGELGDDTRAVLGVEAVLYAF